MKNYIVADEFNLEFYDLITGFAIDNQCSVTFAYVTITGQKNKSDIQYIIELFKQEIDDRLAEAQRLNDKDMMNKVQNWKKLCY
jgi:hypothetical protein